MIQRPAHADPILWGHQREHHGSVVVILSPYKVHPVAHRIIDRQIRERKYAPERGTSAHSWVEDITINCSSAGGRRATSSNVYLTMHAAQYARACRVCWSVPAPTPTTKDD